MKPWPRLYHDERGAVAVVTIALVALLFFAGVAMALAVQSSLRTVGQIRNDDATHYAAESAVARGVAAAIRAPSLDGPCGSQPPSVNGIPISAIECHPVRIATAVPGQVMQWAVPTPSLPSSIDMDLSAVGRTVTIWTVVGSRQLSSIPSSVRVWVDNAGASSCSRPLFAGPRYYVCTDLKGRNMVTLHLASEGGPVSVGAFVVRAAAQGSADSVVTVIGRAGNETGQADVLLPNTGTPLLGFWGTVLP